jgi:hypothetical protein
VLPGAMNGFGRSGNALIASTTSSAAPAMPSANGMPAAAYQPCFGRSSEESIRGRAQ